MNRKIFLYTSVEITKAKLLSENLKSEEEEGEKRGKRKIVVALAMPILPDVKLQCIAKVAFFFSIVAVQILLYVK